MYQSQLESESSSRTFSKILIAALFSIIGFHSLQCTKPVPAANQTQCEQWFLSSSDVFIESIERAGVEEVTRMLGNALRSGQVQNRHNSITLYDTVGTGFSCGFYTPSMIEPGKRYPLIIYLHGGTGTTLNTKGELAYEMLKPLADSMPMFLASPSASRTAQWWTPVGISRIFQVLRCMSLYYPVDPSKIFLAGVSDGAAGCYAVANVAPFPFAGFFAISGYGGIIASTGMKVHPENIRQRPVYNINAGKDRLYPLQIINEFLNYLENSGVAIIRKVYPDEDHGFDYREREFDTLLTLVTTWNRPVSKGNLWFFSPGYPNLIPFCMDWEMTAKPEAATIMTCLSDDTLVIRSNGLQKFIFHANKADQIHFVKFNQSQFKPEFINGNDLMKLKLRYMKYTCHPAIPDGNFIRIGR
ncbi:MAG TPA: hypothetical protein VHO70_12530 [Chitinispirillaceae bacterium]|nr:hypothetical protein [Chitinispirillaceae bacterium]